MSRRNDPWPVEPMTSTPRSGAGTNAFRFDGPENGVIPGSRIRAIDRTILLTGIVEIGLAACAVALVTVPLQMIRLRRRYPALWRWYAWPSFPGWLTRDAEDRKRERFYRDIAFGRIEESRGDLPLRILAILSQVCGVVTVSCFMLALVAYFSHR